MKTPAEWAEWWSAFSMEHGNDLSELVRLVQADAINGLLDEVYNLRLTVALDYRRIETMRQLIADIDASDCLRHLVRCAVFDGKELCSCGRNELQERINKAQEP